MLNVQYAEPDSKGALANLIGWIDFGTKLCLTKDHNTASVTNSLPGGYTISFDLSLDLSGDSHKSSKITYKGFTTPTFKCAPFGNTAYTGIPGRVALYMPCEPVLHGCATIALTLDNIRLTSFSGRPVTTFFMVAADAGVTNRSTETWSVETNSNPWTLLFEMPPICKPSCGPLVTNLYTLNVSEIGTDSDLCNTAANAFITLSPSRLIARAALDGDRAGFAFGVVIPRDVADFTSDVAAISSCLINHVEANTTALFRLPICSPNAISSIIYNGITYPFNSEPLTIIGNLGTYLFYKHKILFMANRTLPNPLFDTFIIRTNQHEDFIVTFSSF